MCRRDLPDFFFLAEEGSPQRVFGERPMTALRIRGRTPAALDKGRTSISSDKMAGGLGPCGISELPCGEGHLQHGVANFFIRWWCWWSRRGLTRWKGCGMHRTGADRRAEGSRAALTLYWIIIQSRRCCNATSNDPLTMCSQSTTE